MSLPSQSLLETKLADLVSSDPRTAAVFDRLGLDYCCQGHRTLRDATMDGAVPLSEVIDEICALGPSNEREACAVACANPVDLVRHIIATHHRYVRESQPIIQGWLDKLVRKHGGRHPELLEIRNEFDHLSAGLMQHMVKEENILFPYVELLCAARSGGTSPVASPFGTVVNPIRVMEEEHQEAGEHLARLRALTSGYQPPPDGCTTYRVCFAELARFEADLRQHVHLENHVLFPRVMALEGAV